MFARQALGERRSLHLRVRLALAIMLVRSCTSQSSLPCQPRVCRPSVAVAFRHVPGDCLEPETVDTAVLRRPAHPWSRRRGEQRLSSGTLVAGGLAPSIVHATRAPHQRVFHMDFSPSARRANLLARTAIVLDAPWIPCVVSRHFMVSPRLPQRACRGDVALSSRGLKRALAHSRRLQRRALALMRGARGSLLW